MLKNKSFSALTGGGFGALDKIDGAALQNLEMAFGVVNGVQHCYWLDEDSGASENSPYVITPDTNAGNKRWILADFQAPFSHVQVNRSTAQSLPNDTETTFIFDTEVKDTLGEYNNATGRFTATYEGYYLVNFIVTCEAAVSWAALELFYAIVDINGASTKRGDRYPAFTSSYGRGACFNSTIYLTAGQYIDCDIYQNQGASINTWASADFNYLTIDRIA